MNLTVCCLFVRGEYPYTVEYVSLLLAMVTRWIDRPFRFCCLTDQPEAMPAGVEPILIEKLSGFAYWSKLELFNPARGWAGRMLYLDLDTLIVAPLAPIVDFPAEFAITEDPVGKQGKDTYGRHIIRRFNSSVMAWDGGSYTYLYKAWSPSVSAMYSGDQDWIGEVALEAQAMPRLWFPRLSEVQQPPFEPDVKVILSKHPKNHLAVRSYPWFAPLWGAA